MPPICISRRHHHGKRHSSSTEDRRHQRIAPHPAVKHGPTAKLYANIVLQGEDQAAYNRMLQSLLAEATLGTTQEAMLIQVLAQSFRKMQRAANMEAGALNSGLAAAQLQLKLSEKPKNDNELSEQLAFVLWEYAGKLDTVRRYANAAERAFFRATKELAQLRKAGPQEQIGYVSQNAETPVEPTEEHKPEARYIATPEPENDLFSNMNEKEGLALLEELTAPPQSKFDIR